jgi:aspartate/methionine/tyrosine aminotransferase
LNLRPFALERYFASYEFSTRYMLGSSDAQPLPIADLLALESGSGEKLQALTLGYTETRGGPELRQAISTLYDHDDPESVLVHAGAQEPIFAFMSALLQPGDRVVVQFPAYQSHYSVAQALGAEIARWPSDLNEEGAPDPAELERLVTPRTRAIVLTTPNNPTGYPFDRARLDAVVEIARRHGLWLFGDEVYRGLEREAERIPTVCDCYERGISLGALSKVYGLAGLRIGWISTRDRPLYDRLAAFKDYLTICNSTPSEFLGELALRHRERLIERVRRIVAANLDRLDAFFARRADVFEWRRPRAGTTAFPRYLRGSSEVFCRRLAEGAGVLLLPGTLFDTADDRIRFGYGRSDLPEALDALDRFIESDARSKETDRVI